jgi:hypothetical protein
LDLDHGAGRSVGRRPAIGEHVIVAAVVRAQRERDAPSALAERQLVHRDAVADPMPLHVPPQAGRIERCRLEREAPHASPARDRNADQPNVRPHIDQRPATC